MVIRKPTQSDNGVPGMTFKGQMDTEHEEISRWRRFNTANISVDDSGRLVLEAVSNEATDDSGDDTGNSEELSYHKIAKFLNSSRILSKRGGRWYAETIKTIYGNKLYDDPKLMELAK